MTLKASLFLFFYCLATVLSVAKAQDRSPHGLANEHPIAFSPSAYDFFHPNDVNPCISTACSPFPLAAQVQSMPAHESRYATSHKGGSQFGAGGVAAIVFSLTFVVLVAMGVYYVVVTRRTNMSRGGSVQPDA